MAARAEYLALLAELDRRRRTNQLAAYTPYRKLALAYVSGSGTLPTTANGIWLMFDRAGDKGADGAGVGDFTGPASSVADNIVTFAGTTGKVGKDSGIKASDLIAGPASAVADNIATFNGTTGKLAKDSGVAVSSLAPKNSPSLTTPTLGVAPATSINKVAITAPATSATLTLLNGTTLTGPAASGTVMTLGNAETVSGVKTFSAIPIMSGGGIAFPAIDIPSVDANTLDDYEEGTFTPAFSATSCTFSYAEQTGVYAKIGRCVQIHVQLGLNTTGNTLAANAVTVTGLPFTSASALGPRLAASWGQSTTNYVFVQGSVTAASTAIGMFGATAAATGNTSALLANGLLHATNASTIRLTGFYLV